MRESSSETSVTGIRSHRECDRWLVPPWRVEASLCEVVRHFLRFAPREGACTADRIAYYEGHAAAIEAAPKFELTHPWDWRWYAELQHSIARCIQVYQEKQTAERQPDSHDTPRMIPAPDPRPRLRDAS